MVRSVFLFVLAHIHSVYSANSLCEVVARTQAGAVCGRVIGNRLAVFRGVPYAEQPVGKRRFQELQPLMPWKGILDATVEGPVCPQAIGQHDGSWLALQNITNMSEACIHANIHTPLNALPRCKTKYRQVNNTNSDVDENPGLPVLVFMHGGNWQSGSGNSDFYGPEHFIDRDVVMITFNYRLNVFGFMSLNTSDVPGNQGLRDVLHLLRWVRDNVHYFGGNPDDVTLMGQSAGSTSVHLVALSPHSKGLIKRLILSSGTALPSYFTTSPAYMQRATNLLLNKLGINSTDPSDAFKQLIDLPLETILTAYKPVQDLYSFGPVTESQFQGIPTMIKGDPAVLAQEGALDIPLLIGFNSNECPMLQNQFEGMKFTEVVKTEPYVILPPNLLMKSSNETVTKLTAEVKTRYFEGDITSDNFMELCADSRFVYPALKIAQIRAASNASDTFLYTFSYEGEFRPIVVGLNLKPYKGVAHVEDLPYIFRANKFISEHPPRATPVDDRMRNSWINTIINFMKCSRPICGAKADSWPPVSSKGLAYQDIRGPEDFRSTPISEKQHEMIAFFDKIKSIF